MAASTDVVGKVPPMPSGFTDFGGSRTHVSPELEAWARARLKWLHKKCDKATQEERQEKGALTVMLGSWRKARAQAAGEAKKQRKAEKKAAKRAAKRKMLRKAKKDEKREFWRKLAIEGAEETEGTQQQVLETSQQNSAQQVPQPV